MHWYMILIYDFDIWYSHINLFILLVNKIEMKMQNKHIYQRFGFGKIIIFWKKSSKLHLFDQKYGPISNTVKYHYKLKYFLF